MRTHSMVQNRRSVGVDSSAVSEVGTVLWIGERQTRDFRDAYRYTEAAASQMAYRSDWTEALSRPACDVQRILVAQVDRSPLPPSNIEQLANRYVDAQWLALEGPLCAGVSRRQANRPIADSCYLHQWRQYLPQWLEHIPDEPVGSVLETARRVKNAQRSLGIIATDSANASTLMDLAASTLATAVWFRSPSSHRMCNFDIIWWDDSAVAEESSDQWITRLQPNQTHAFREHAVHVWLTNTTRRDAIDHAYAAGVTLVLTKPFQVESLIQTLAFENNCNTSQNVASAMRSRIAA